MLHTEDPIHQGSYTPNSSVDRGSPYPPERCRSVQCGYLKRSRRAGFGLPAAGGKLVSRATELLSAEYPDS
jgi:hypothetical protein